MTIRKKILLFSALALGAFLAAVYLVSRFSLLNAFARLESDAARENVRHMQSGLKNEQAHLEILAVDYGQWDRTYDFMQNRDPSYVRTELSPDALKGIQISFVVLFDRSGEVVVSQSNGGWLPTPEDLKAIATVYKRAQSSGAQIGPLTGVLQLKDHLALLSYHPVVTTQGSGTPRNQCFTHCSNDRLRETVIGSSAGSSPN